MRSLLTFHGTSRPTIEVHNDTLGLNTIPDIRLGQAIFTVSIFGEEVFKSVSVNVSNPSNRCRYTACAVLWLPLRDKSSFRVVSTGVTSMLCLVYVFEIQTEEYIREQGRTREVRQTGVNDKHGNKADQNVKAHLAKATVGI